MKVYTNNNHVPVDLELLVRYSIGHFADHKKADYRTEIYRDFEDKIVLALFKPSLSDVVPLCFTRYDVVKEEI